MLNLMIIAGAIGGGQPEITLSGQVVSSSTIGSNAVAGIRISSDGNVYEYTTLLGVYTQIDTVDDWLRPTDDATDYEVRITNVNWVSGTTFLTEAAAADAWVSITGNMDWEVTDTDVSLSGLQDVTFTIEIGYIGQSTALASGSYQLTADYEGI